MQITSSIIGVKFHKGAHDKLLDSPTGTPVALVREPENQYDANAIQCVVDGVICGYIPHAVYLYRVRFGIAEVYPGKGCSR